MKVIFTLFLIVNFLFLAISNLSNRENWIMDVVDNNSKTSLPDLYVTEVFLNKSFIHSFIFRLTKFYPVLKKFYLQTVLLEKLIYFRVSVFIEWLLICFLCLFYIIKIAQINYYKLKIQNQNELQIFYLFQVFQNLVMSLIIYFKVSLKIIF